MCSIMPVLSAAPDPGRLRSIRFTSWGFCGLQSRTLTQDSHPHLRASLKGTVQARDAVHTDYRMSGGMSVEGSEVRSGCVHPLSRSSWRKLSSHEPHQGWERALQKRPHLQCACQRSGHKKQEGVATAHISPLTCYHISWATWSWK